MWKCKHCKKDFDFTRNTDKAGHSRWCDKNPKAAQARKDNAARKVQSNDKKFGKITLFDVTCNCCEGTFRVQERKHLFPQKDQYYCGSSCANFRGKGVEWADRRGSELIQYRTICWAHHEKKCCICGEENVVEAHHYDEDHNNNTPENFVPLCPTHHQYWHSGFRHLIEADVNQYVIDKWALT